VQVKLFVQVTQLGMKVLHIVQAPESTKYPEIQSVQAVAPVHCKQLLIVVQMIQFWLVVDAVTFK
jgi:hypothetical protein